MLDNIRLHVNTNEEEQQQLERQLTEHMSKTFKANVNKLQRTIPSLVPYSAVEKRRNISIFCNKNGEYNLVDYGQGKVVYGFNPHDEVMAQVDRFCEQSPFVSFANDTSFQTPETTDTLSESLPKLQNFAHCDPLPDRVDCLVVLGCGLGIHISELIARKRIKHLVIYEREEQFFSASLLVTNWKAILDQADAKGTALYVQIGNDSRSIIEDMEELSAHDPIKGFYLYKHFNDNVYTQVFDKLVTHQWQQVKQEGVHYVRPQDKNNYCPLWTPPISLESIRLPDKEDAKFSANMAALARYYPNIHQQFKDYSPKLWIPVQNNLEQINLINKETLVAWYSDSPAEDGQILCEDFEQHPNKDGLIMGYTGEKLLHYAHYQFVQEIDEVLKQHEDKRGSLPDDIQSVILFGLGAGYQLEALLKKHAIDNLFICEPNPDFFYASLFCIDWASILEKVDKMGARIYINVGDDGSNLFKDLLSQFYAIGPYILNNTYFFQGYRNEVLNQAIAQLREQLQIVISMGEYFDHAYYGINHTLEGIRREYPILKSAPSQSLTQHQKDVPVFIIGSGPSIDEAIEAIKGLKQKAIIVSCGTALKMLYKHGITPDFHAEIEQNRATFEWVSLIEDSHYTQSISLLACNGIQPDTCDLFKDTYVVFKEGESSTVSTLEVLGEHTFEVIQFAFPTVANLAINVFSTMGFRSIYLLGVDLGFIDKEKHHSTATGYYDNDGKAVSNYTDKYNMSLVVEGNFRPTVMTKTEFKISKQIIEQTIASSSKDIHIYNCSDGAKIRGATPLAVDNILIVSSEEDKSATLDVLKGDCFTRTNITDFDKKYSDKFCPNVLKTDFSKLLDILSEPVSSNKDAARLIEKQKEYLFNSYRSGRSLLFYYLYGTMNYANAVLTQLVDHKKPSEPVSDDIHQAVDIWKDNLSRMAHLALADINLFDSTTVHSYGVREAKYLQRTVTNKKLLVITDSVAFEKSILHFVRNEFGAVAQCTVASHENAKQLKINADFIIFDLLSNPKATKALQGTPFLDHKGKENTLFVSSASETQIAKLCSQHNDCTFLHIPSVGIFKNNEHIFINRFYLAIMSLRACFDGLTGTIMQPKYYVSKDANPLRLKQFAEKEYSTSQLILDFHEFLVFVVQPARDNQLMTNAKTRGKPLLGKLGAANFISYEADQDEYENAINHSVSMVPEVSNESLYAD